MTQHLHNTHVPGCYRCELREDEARDHAQDDARAEAQRRWPSYPTVGFSGADDRQAAFVAGAEWAAGRAETTTATTEQAARVLRSHTDMTDRSANDGCECGDLGPHHAHQAEVLAAAGLLARPTPARQVEGGTDE